jgi:hypothetical protein
MNRLTIIKTIHTIIWVFFNVILFYLFYAVITNKIDKRVWIGFSLFAAEAIVLLIFRMACPLTILARNYSNSTKANFDIFLPNWLAKHNKLIYSILLGIVILLLLFRLFQN